MVESLQRNLKDADIVLMNHHINAPLKIFASGFADQKRASYRFGPNSGGVPAITQELSLEKFDKFQTHTICIENAFGVMDNLL